MRSRTKWLLFGGGMGTAAATAAAYGLVARPWHLRWGATRDEIGRSMPFDALIGRPNYSTTRALTIDATPDQTWVCAIDGTALPAGTVIRHVDAENYCIVFAPPEVEAEATWVVVLQPMEGNRTRLISRNRAHFPRRAAAILRYLLVDPMQFLLERRWLLDVKRRAEALALAQRVVGSS